MVLVTPPAQTAAERELRGGAGCPPVSALQARTSRIASRCVPTAPRSYRCSGAGPSSRRIMAVLILAAGMLALVGHPADADSPVHICGTVTEYFVSDIPSGGFIEIDGKGYPIASSASYSRRQPLPDVRVGSDVCLDGTANDTGALLDFVVTPRDLSSTPAPRAVSTAPPSPPSAPSVAEAWLVPVLALFALAVGGLVAAWAIARSARPGRPHR